MDKDGDGSVTMQELGIFDQSWNRQDLETMINQADEDGNGAIELPEYLAQLAREESFEGEEETFEDEQAAQSRG